MLRHVSFQLSFPDSLWWTNWTQAYSAIFSLPTRQTRYKFWANPNHGPNCQRKWSEGAGVKGGCRGGMGVYRQWVSRGEQRGYGVCTVCTRGVQGAACGGGVKGIGCWGCMEVWGHLGM